MQFSERFTNGLKLVRSSYGANVYMRRNNQTPTYYLMIGGQIRHVSSGPNARHTIFKAFRRYRNPSMFPSTFHEAN